MNAIAKKSARLKLTDEEKILFVDAFIEYQLAEPEAHIKHLIQKARLILPANRRFAESIDSMNHLNWMKPLYEARKRKIEEKSRGIKKGSSITRFNAEERMIFAEAVWNAQHSNRGLTKSQCIEEANKSMPPERQLGKTVVQTGFSSLKWLQPLLDEIRARKAKEAEEKRLAEIRKKEEQEAAEKAKAEAEAQSLREIESASVLPPVVDLNKLVIDAIVAAVRTSVQQIVQSPQLQNAIQDAIAPSTVPAPIHQSIPQQHIDTRKKVLVVGLLPIQYNEVQREYGRHFDLRFKDANCPVPQVKESMKNVDFAVLMTKFTSHATANAMRGHPGFVFCNGNSTALKMLLKEKMQ